MSPSQSPVDRQDIIFRANTFLQYCDEMKFTSVQTLVLTLVGVALGPSAVAAWGAVGHETIGFVCHCSFILLFAHYLVACRYVAMSVSYPIHI